MHQTATQITLEKIRLTVVEDLRVRRLEQLFANAKIDLFKLAGGNMAARLSTHVLGLKGERVHFYRKWPLDWREAFKQRWFPRWWLRRWPVRWATIDEEIQTYKCVCPHIATTAPPEMDSVTFHLMHLQGHLDPLDPEGELK